MMVMVVVTVMTMMTVMMVMVMCHEALKGKICGHLSNHNHMKGKDHL